MCPRCRKSQTKRIGFYRRKSGRINFIQRFFCHLCRFSFSSQTLAAFRGDRKPHVNQKLFRLLCSGTSQRRAAELLGIHRNTVASKLIRFGRLSRMGRCSPAEGLETVYFDEMETFEHTKCKPLSIALAVEHKSRKIIAARVARMPAKGLLAEISKKKYGAREDNRPLALDHLMRRIKRRAPHLTTLKSDEAPRYPKFVRRHFGGRVIHERYKGRRGCVVGQGELKRGGRDPLFFLNHTAAMIRDNVKRLSRRTWCTTKDPARLQDLLDLYSVYHNQRMDGLRGRIRFPTRIVVGEAQPASICMA